MRMAYSRPSSVTIGVLIAVGIIVPALVAAELVLGLQGTVPTTIQNSSAPSTSSSTIIPGPCAGASAYTGLDSPAAESDNGSLSFPIFSMPENGTAEVCVVYTDAAAPVNAAMNLTDGALVGTFGTAVFSNGTVVHPFIAASGVSVTPNQTQVALGGTGPTTIDVAYTIRTNASSKGFYFLNIGGLTPEICNNEFRFAVGYDFTQGNQTGSYFPLPSGFSSCGVSGGTFYSDVYEVKDMIVTPLLCGMVTCDLNETG
jgi:hypothetical protein